MVIVAHRDSAVVRPASRETAKKVRTSLGSTKASLAFTFDRVSIVRSVEVWSFEAQMEQSNSSLHYNFTLLLSVHRWRLLTDNIYRYR